VSAAFTCHFHFGKELTAFFNSIVDSAIYIPNPNNASDNYSIYTDGHNRDVFMKNPDGTEYIGSGMVYPD
jgi:alpha-glucosidase (family GH31 glycosyl hydrolase)